MTIFWPAVLERINGVSTSLRKPIIDLRTAVDLLKSLLDFLLSQRELFENNEMKVNEKTYTEYSDENHRARKEKKSR